MSTKERILEAGLLLFNQDGVENVTTRHIATELGISQGNLHYHYPNKNEVILALLQEFFSELKSAQSYTGGVFDRREMLLSMKANFKIMQNYRFFFLEDKVIWRRLPEVKVLLLEHFAVTRSRIEQVIDAYRSEGLFRSEVTDYQLGFLLDQFLFSITSWLHSVDYMTLGGDPPAHFAKYTFSIWLSYLIPEEAREWEKTLVLS